MKLRISFAILLAFLLASCAPRAFVPSDDPLPDVVLTAMPIDGATTYRVEAGGPVNLFLRFPGIDLRTNTPECVASATDIRCVGLQIDSFFELTIVGDVADIRTLGFACREACHPLLLVE